MLWRKHEVRRAEDRVRTGRENRDVYRFIRELAARTGCDRRDPGQDLEILHAELDLGAVGATDPVSLRLFRRLRPIDRLEIVEQMSGVISDSEEPLLEESLFDLLATPLAFVSDDLFVCEDCLVVCVSVYCCSLLVGLPSGVELKEK